MATTDASKAQLLAATFFPPLPGEEGDRERAIEHAWSTERPPGPGEAEGVTPAETALVIKGLRVAAAPGIDGIPP